MISVLTRSRGYMGLGTKGLPNIYGTTGPGNFIFRHQITGRSHMYESLKFQASIQDISSNTSFFEAGGTK